MLSLGNDVSTYILSKCDIFTLESLYVRYPYYYDLLSSSSTLTMLCAYHNIRTVRSFSEYVIYYRILYNIGRIHKSSLLNIAYLNDDVIPMHLSLSSSVYYSQQYVIDCVNNGKINLTSNMQHRRILGCNVCTALLRVSDVIDQDLIRISASKGKFDTAMKAVASRIQPREIVTAVFEGMLESLRDSTGAVDDVYKKTKKMFSTTKVTSHMFLDCLASAVMLGGYHDILDITCNSKLLKRLDVLMTGKSFRLSSPSSWDYLESRGIYPGTRILYDQEYFGSSLEVVKRLHRSSTRRCIYRVARSAAAYNVLIDNVINAVIQHNDITSFNWMSCNGIVSEDHYDAVTMDSNFKKRILKYIHISTHLC